MRWRSGSPARSRPIGRPCGAPRRSGRRSTRRCRAWHPWQPARVPRVRYLLVNSERTNTPFREAFLQELRALGYVEGRNVLLEARYADDRADQLSTLADELVRLPVDVIVTYGTQA